MEAIFYALVDITPQDLEEENQEQTHGEEEILKSVSKLVKSASQIALNKFKRKTLITPGFNVPPEIVGSNFEKLVKQPGQQLSTSKGPALIIKTASTVTSLVAHQVKTVVGGIKSIALGRQGRPTWSIPTHFAFHWLRNSLQYKGFDNEMIRMGERIGSDLIASALNVTGVQVQLCKFSVSMNQLLWYEERGEKYQRKRDFTTRYPIPMEHPLVETEYYSIDGEWLIPDVLAKYSKDGVRTFKDNIYPAGGETQTPRKVILFLHGGAYIMGNAKLYRSLTGILAKHSGTPILAINYRRAPEYPFPAGLHDAFAAYLWLIKPNHHMFQSEESVHEPYHPKDIIIAGDSAGGGLTMALLNYINMYLCDEEGNHLVPLPAAAILLSPWVDLSCSSKSWQENNGLDFLPPQAHDLHAPLFTNMQHPVYSYCFGDKTGRHLDILSPTGSRPFGRIPSIGNALSELPSLNLPPSLISNTRVKKEDEEWLREAMQEHERDALERFVRHPLVSPVYGQFKGLCPILVQVGECELLRDETIALAYRYKSDNENSSKSWVRHELYVDMLHDFQAGYSVIPAAKLAIKQFSRFCEEIFSESEMPSGPISFSVAESEMIKMIDSHIDV